MDLCILQEINKICAITNDVYKVTINFESKGQLNFGLLTAHVGNKVCRKYGNLIYRKVSNIRCTKSPNLNVSRLVLHLAVLNRMKPGVKSRMKL